MSAVSEMREKLRGFIAAHRAEMLRDLAALVEVPSVAKPGKDGLPYGAECRQVLRRAEAIARKLGFVTEIHDDAVMTVRWDEREPNFCLLAHLDVVPAGEGWTTPPYELTVEADCIRGRGVTDDKGPAIASLYAMAAVRELCPDLPVPPMLWLGTAEEIGSGDLKHYLEGHAMPPYVITPDAVDAIVIGECAKYRPAVSAAWKRSDALPRVTHLQGGRVRNAIPAEASATVAGLTADEVREIAQAWTAQTEVAFTLTDTAEGIAIRATGRGAHIGKPCLGRNAQTALVELLSKLPLADCGSARAIRAMARCFPYADPYGEALGLTVEDAVMGKCRINATTCMLHEEGVALQFDGRGGALATEENFARVIDRALTAAGFTVEKSEMDAAHFVPPESEIVQEMRAIWRAVRGCEPQAVSMVAGSYAHFVPGAIAVGRAAPGIDCRIHKSDEWLPLADFDRLVELLALAMLRFGGENV